MQQRHMSNHQEWCFCAVPGSSSAKLISQIYRTHCIQSTHLLRTSAKQNPSLLIAAVSKNRAYSMMWGRRGAEKAEQREQKKMHHMNVRDSSTEKSLWALLLRRTKSWLSKKNVIYSFLFFSTAYTSSRLEWYTRKMHHKRLQTDCLVSRYVTTRQSLHISLYVCRWNHFFVPVVLVRVFVCVFVCGTGSDKEGEQS